MRIAVIKLPKPLGKLLMAILSIFGGAKGDSGEET